VATPLPEAHLLLSDVTAVVQTMCLASHSLATAVYLAPQFCLSGFMSQYYNVRIYVRMYDYMSTFAYMKLSTS
jgi:hypothetical protein